MTRKKKTALILLSAALIATAVVFSFGKDKESQQETLPVNFFMPERFWDGVSQEQEGNQKTNQSVKIYAGVVPHHLVAGRLISNMFKALKDQGVKKIILIGPNHHEEGVGNLQYSFNSWQTPFGKVEGYSAFKAEPPAEKATIINEHSVSGLMPYIAYYLPDAKVFSVIIKHKTGDKELENLAQQIVEASGKDTSVLASVDFSHYLPHEIAEEKDEYTRQLLLELNEKPLYGLNNDYLDSPASISLMMKVCKKRGLKNFSINQHSNSAIILNNPYLASTTSYFTGYCGER